MSIGSVVVALVLSVQLRVRFCIQCFQNLLSVFLHEHCRAMNRSSTYMHMGGGITPLTAEQAGHPLVKLRSYAPPPGVAKLPFNALANLEILPPLGRPCAFVIDNIPISRVCTLTQHLLDAEGSYWSGLDQGRTTLFLITAVQKCPQKPHLVQQEVQNKGLVAKMVGQR